MQLQTKKRSIISYQNLSEEALVLFHETYPEGYTHAIQKIVKPSGDSIFVVPFETSEAYLMVKVDVKVDTKLSEEEFDKEILAATKNTKEPEFEEEEEESSNESKDKFTLIHGDYSDKNIDSEEEEEEEEEEEDI